LKKKVFKDRKQKVIEALEKLPPIEVVCSPYCPEDRAVMWVSPKNFAIIENLKKGEKP